jgi:5-methylcytosine-specific restriction protein A
MIPKSIERSHVEKAIAKILKEGIPTMRQSKRWNLINGKLELPPKYVLSIAYTFVSGKEWTPDRFSGGPETNTFLAKLGFEIVDKKTGQHWSDFQQELDSDYIPFQRGRGYSRTDIHDFIGGNRQKGISTPEGSHFILIFSGEGGKAFGYDDGWIDESTFRYTGEGQSGDMVFKMGNLELRDHLKTGKRVLAFQKAANDMHIFLGEMVVIRWNHENLKDVHGKMRKAIVFYLTLKDEEGDPDDFDSEEDLDAVDFNELRKRAYEASVDVTEKGKTVANYRKRVHLIKVYTGRRAKGSCESCGREFFTKVNGTLFFYGHHIEQVGLDGPDSPENVSAICSECHSVIHYGRDGPDLNEKLRVKIAKIEKELKVKCGSKSR